MPFACCAYVKHIQDMLHMCPGPFFLLRNYWTRRRHVGDTAYVQKKKIYNLASPSSIFPSFSCCVSSFFLTFSLSIIIFKKYWVIWYGCLSNTFQFLNNVTCIFIYFFTHKYFLKIQITLLNAPYFFFLF